MRYIVASLDVIGDPETGWEVNDLHQIGTIDVTEDVLNDDSALLNVLAENGYTEDTSDELEFVGDDSELTLHYWTSGLPVLSLIRQQ
jgi:hypothetical protein